MLDAFSADDYVAGSYLSCGLNVGAPDWLIIEAHALRYRHAHPALGPPELPPGDAHEDGALNNCLDWIHHFNLEAAADRPGLAAGPFHFAVDIRESPPVFQVQIGFPDLASMGLCGYGVLKSPQGVGNGCAIWSGF